MKKVIVFVLSLALVLSLVSLPLTASAVQPTGYWPYYTAYKNAVKTGSVDTVLKTGDELLAFYSKFALNSDIAGMSYNVYYYRYVNAVFGKKGNYDAAISNARKLEVMADYLGFTDMAVAAHARSEKLDPMTEVYALSNDETPPTFYGAKYEPESGSYYGRVASAGTSSLKNAPDIAKEAVVSFYVELGLNTAADFAWMISPYDDGRHVVQIALNFPDEARTAAQMVSGADDGNIGTTLRYLDALRCPVLLRIGGEMNLWEMDPVLFKDAYIHVASLAHALAPNAALVWSPNCVGSWGSKMSDFYPGDTYVDWVGASLYCNSDTAAGQTPAGDDSMYFGRGAFADCVLSMKEVDQLATSHSKPVIVTEGGTGIVSNTAGQRYDNEAAAQTTKRYTALNMVYPNIKTIVYFDFDNNGDTYKYVDIWGYGDTVSSNSMNVTYYLAGRELASPDALPYHLALDTLTLLQGRYEFDAVFNDGAGFLKTKSYTLTKTDKGSIVFTEGFSAVPDAPSDWAKDEVDLALALSLVPDVLQTRFSAGITRLDFCRLVIRLIEQKTGKPVGRVMSDRGAELQYGIFTDAPDNNVLEAYALGIVSGRGNGLFDGSAGITREEAAKMLKNAADILGISQDSSAVTFADADTFSQWAAASIKFVSSTADEVTGKLVMGGIGGNLFGPKAMYSYQQAYMTMLRLLRASP